MGSKWKRRWSNDVNQDKNDFDGSNPTAEMPKISFSCGLDITHAVEHHSRNNFAVVVWRNVFAITVSIKRKANQTPNMKQPPYSRSLKMDFKTTIGGFFMSGRKIKTQLLLHFCTD